MPKIFARVDEEQACPLYRRGEGMEFAFPSVLGMGCVPVCMKAVMTFATTLLRLQRGEDPASFTRVFCGGCTGKAWFSFSKEPEGAAARFPPDAAASVLRALSRSPLFAGLRTSYLERILPLLRARRCQPGETIIQQGQVGRAMAVILGGEYEVLQQSGSDQSVIATFGPGDCFGEMALITGEATSATVRCRAGGTLLEIHRDDFPRLVGHVPAVGLALARILSTRLNRTSSWIIEQIKKGILGRLEMIPPADLLQAMNVSNQTGVLLAFSADHTFSLHMENGQPVHAQLGQQAGEEAVYAFLGWAEGSFRFEPGAHHPARSIHTDSTGLLLEAMRRKDEATSRLARADAAEPVPFLDSDPGTGNSGSVDPS
ncbi:MAG: DUF4388 domain-containing protein [Planctomycetes bacterium]|nr:DUF4388 domain-containing protein [Planctomycetota bacterium]